MARITSQSGGSPACAPPRASVPLSKVSVTLLSSPDPGWYPMKTQMSRFQIHDDLTAPEGSLPVLKGAQSGGGQLPNFLGVLAGSPAAVRAYARFRSELRHGTLPLPTLERISLAVAQHYR